MYKCFITLASVLLLLSSCSKEESLELGQRSKGVLQDNTSECLPKFVTGNYIAGAAFTDSNFVDIVVDVTQPGYFSIYTDTVNGFYFTGTGHFDSVGVHLARLKAIGQPLTEGDHNFTVFFDSSYCSFPVQVQPAGTLPQQPGTGDYFPISSNSWWSYNYESGTDTIRTEDKSTIVFGGNTYHAFYTTDDLGDVVDSVYYRKAGSDYFNYYTNEYMEGLGLPVTSASGGFDILFLKEGLTSGAVFDSDHSATVSGLPVTVRFHNTCLDANATVSVNGVTFTGVYKVQTVVQLGVSGTFSDAGTPLERYYARGVGLIKVRNPLTLQEQNIRFWEIK